MDNLSENIALKSLETIESLSKKDLRNNRRIILKYSGHFKNYNSNVKYTREYLQFNMSSDWKNVDEDIQRGVIESLIVRMFKLKGIKTQNMELYESFLKGLSKYAKKHSHDPQLEESFNRINLKFFDGMMDKPNLIFASESFRKLGSYEYGSDTIYMSTIFRDLPSEDIIHLDYVMYHELLHKKHKFYTTNGQHRAHTKAFRDDEAKFGLNAEQELHKFLRRKQRAISLMNRSSSREKTSWFKFW